MSTLRPIEQTDACEIARIERECFPDPWSITAWQAELARPDFFGYAFEEGGQLVAYACATALFEDSELLKIAVSPSLQGKGIGGKLLDILLDGAKARGAERMFLEVRATNIPALKLYKSRGFAKTRERKKYYSDGTDAVEMVKGIEANPQ